MKNRILNFLGDTADQICSTAIWCFVVYAMIKGMVSLIEEPPSYLFMGIIVAFGFFLGTLKYFTDEKLTKDIKRENDVED
jgi:hypothetical protein